VTAGQITRLEDVNKLLDMYYEQRGWTPNGVPTLATLEKLGLAQLVA
jgi:aldehyde:ferredoxin oxidoreductase